MKIKKLSAIVLAATLAAASFAGCGSKQAAEEISAASEEVREAAGISEVAGAVESGEETRTSVVFNGQNLEVAKSDKLEDVSFVLIYNPYIYDEMDSVTGNVNARSLYTGSLGNQIITGGNRAGGLDDFEVPAVMSQAELRQGLEDLEVDREGVKAGGLQPVYDKGDTEYFYHYDANMQSRISDRFDCRYAGDTCYVWVLKNQISDSEAESLGMEFDDLIFENDTENFGEGRYISDGGKVHILVYDLNMQGLGGFFTICDIYSSAECTQAQVEYYGLNTDKAIININGKAVKQLPEYAKSTLAHEYQHMICASEAFYFALTPFVKTWLDETMAAYAEEISYPGIKEEGYYNQLMYFSDNYRCGQSLYNFTNDNDEYIGSYGAVYLFSQYMKDLAGDDVFWYVHNYWRNSFKKDVTEAEALYNSVPEDAREYIDGNYTYSDEILQGFGSYEEAWMSKLTLDFILETVKMDLANLKGHEDSVHAMMLYTSINPVDIEGGGRIFVAPEDGTFTIPSDADKDLIYIGFDRDFNIVTNMIVAP